jgi:hypothetical protein
MFGVLKQSMRLGLAASAILLSGVQAQAMTLTGGVEESSFFKGNPISSLSAAPQAKPKAKPVVHHSKNSQPAVNFAEQVPLYGKLLASQTKPVRPITPPAAIPITPPAAITVASPSTTPATVQGVWMCTTRVVESSAPTVQAGTIVECQIKFQALDANCVVAQWAQQGWTPAAAAVGQCGGGILRITHESASRGFSAAHSDDYVQVVNPNVMRSISIVNQFENGAYAGSYKTQSILRRI